MPQPLLFIFAGEQSGDFYGALLIRAIKKLAPHFRIVGVGGPQMRQEGMSCVAKMEDFQILGFGQVLTSLFKISKQLRFIREEVLRLQPQLTIFVDYPGFNLRMAKALRKRGFRHKLVQYVSPSVWAYGKGRIQKMAKTLDLLVALFPFEPPLFSRTSLDVRYFGHPLYEVIQNYSYSPSWNQEVGISDLSHLVALFPGSRKKEIFQNLPKQLEAARLLKERHPNLCFGISVGQEEASASVKRMIEKKGLTLGQDAFLVPKKYSYELMRHCCAAAGKAGTVTLELALHHTPTVAVYQLSLFNRFFIGCLLQILLPHYCIVNILGNKRIFPELIKKGFSARNLCYELEQLIYGEKKRQECLKGCQEVTSLLKPVEGSSAVEGTTKAILEK